MSAAVSKELAPLPSSLAASVKHTSSPDKSRRIVCAALRKGEQIICGVRHFDQIMRTAIEALSSAPKFDDWRHAEQGFVNQRGEFLTREEAFEVAEANGQIAAGVAGRKRRLFSEDLY